MKRRIVFLLCAFLLFGCTLLHFITFEEVSKPYLDKYGVAEETSKYTSGNCSTVDWWWWTKGFEVSFEDSPYDEVNGWTVSSTYEFDPIP